MKNFQMLLELYMRVNGLSRIEMAEAIGIPKNALRRISEDKVIKHIELMQIIAWLFAGGAVE